MIGYPSGQDGMELSCPLESTRCVMQEKFPREPNNKSFIDQAFLVKMAGYWPRFFAHLWTSTPSRSMNTQKKELGQYPVIRTSHLVNTHTSVLVPLYVSSFVFLLQVCNCFFHSVTYILVYVNKLILLIT